jgi:hypothetical protein
VVTKGHDEIAGEITVAWINALAQVTQGTNCSFNQIKEVLQALSQESVATFYDHVYRQVRQTYNGAELHER